MCTKRVDVACLFHSRRAAGAVHTSTACAAQSTNTISLPTTPRLRSRIAAQQVLGSFVLSRRSGDAGGCRVDGRHLSCSGLRSIGREHQTESKAGEQQTVRNAYAGATEVIDTLGCFCQNGAWLTVVWQVSAAAHQLVKASVCRTIFLSPLSTVTCPSASTSMMTESPSFGRNKSSFQHDNQNSPQPKRQVQGNRLRGEHSALVRPPP